MLDKKYLIKIRKNLLAYAEKRREIIKKSGDALHLAKKAIFALHRDDLNSAESCLLLSRETLSCFAKKYQKNNSILEEGSYRAAIEEYVEAELFYRFIKGEKIGEIVGLPVDPNIFIGGLADVPGELLRFAVKSATERKFNLVEECLEAASAIIGEMVDMDLTGYNRQKFDQAKQALRKLEEVRYEVSLKNFSDK